MSLFGVSYFNNVYDGLADYFKRAASICVQDSALPELEVTTNEVTDINGNKRKEFKRIDAEIEYQLRSRAAAIIEILKSFFNGCNDTAGIVLSYDDPSYGYWFNFVQWIA